MFYCEIHGHGFKCYDEKHRMDTEKAFELAFDFVGRVASLYDEVDNISHIKCDSKPINHKVIQLIREVGGMEKASAYFNDYYKPKMLPRFIGKLHKDRTQPKEYWQEGTLSIDKPNETVIEYSNKPYEN